MKRLFIKILVLSLLFGWSAYSEEIFISCKEIDREKITKNLNEKTRLLSTR